MNLFLDLETETAIALITDSVINSIRSDIGGTAFWAGFSQCCLEPLVLLVENFDQFVLVVVE
jgi:hypothetical protein